MLGSPARGDGSGVLIRRATLALVLGMVLSSAAAPGLGMTVREYQFCHEAVLGTSLELTVITSSQDRAQACEAAVLSEVERLRRILSTYDPASEISRLNASSEEISVSPELFEVLSLYELWRLRTGGLFNVRVGSILQAWKRAEREQRLPDPAALEALCRGMEGMAVALDPERRTARRLTSHLLGINAIGKNYILEKALASALAQDSALGGILLSIGGDIVCRGSASGAPGDPWHLGVIDPKSSYDNALPLCRILLRDGAVASSGSYERRFKIGQERFSYIVDPRTGWPARDILGATVIAPDAVTADALSTTLCILPPDEGLSLIRQVPGAECVITSSDGAAHESPGWRTYVAPAAPVEIRQPRNSAWPDKFQVDIELVLAAAPPTQPGKPYRRPYLAVWVEDPAGKPVRTIAVWGNNPKHQPELGAWWALAGKNADLVKAVSKATRDAGKYTLVWDGLDDKGKAVPQGAYVVRIEVSREFGRHFKDMTAPIACRTKAVKADIKSNTEIDSVRIKYGPEP